MTSCDRDSKRDSKRDSTKAANNNCPKDKPASVAAQWEKLSPRAKKVVAGLMALDLGLLAAAWHFLYHLPKNRIRGKKLAWFALTLIDIVGPLTFLLCGIERKAR